MYTVPAWLSEVLQEQKLTCYRSVFAFLFGGTDGEKQRSQLLFIILYDLINTVICCSFQCSAITESGSQSFSGTDPKQQ